MVNNTVIGTGFNYPVYFSDLNKTQLLELVTGTDAIKQSIFLVLSTKIGERYNNPKFGSKLYSLVFEPNTNLLKDLLYFYTVEALRNWEPRISINNIEFINFVDNQNLIGLNIFYTIKETYEAGNYVYPFVRNGETLQSMLNK
jgi:uncharacterized protein